MASTFQRGASLGMSGGDSSGVVGKFRSFYSTIEQVGDRRHNVQADEASVRPADDLKWELLDLSSSLFVSSLRISI